MAFITENKQYFTNDGIPYVWGSGGIDPSTFSVEKLWVAEGDNTNRFLGVSRPSIGGGYILTSQRSNIYNIQANDKILQFIARPDLVDGTNGLSNYMQSTSLYNFTRFSYNSAGLDDVIFYNSTNKLDFTSTTFYHQGRLIVGTLFNDRFAIIYPYRPSSINNALTLTKYSDTDFPGTFSSSTWNGFGMHINVGNGRIVTSNAGIYFRSWYFSNKSVFVTDLNGEHLTTIDDPLNDIYSKFGGSGWYGLSEGLYNAPSQGIAIGNGRIVVGSPNTNRTTSSNYSGIGSIYIYDVYGNLIKTINRNDSYYQSYAESKGLNRLPGNTSRYGGGFGMYVDVACGRIAATSIYEGYQGNSSQRGATWLFDLNGNLVDLLTTPVTEGQPAPSNPTGSTAYHQGSGLSVAIGSGIVAVGDPTSNRYRTNEGEVYLYNLDGDYLQTLRHPGRESSGINGDNNYFGLGIAIKDGLLAITSPGYGSNRGALWVYKVPKVYTAYDILDFDQGGW